MHSPKYYRTEFLKLLSEKKLLREPPNLYEPIEYILKLGGKRLRPVLTLMGYSLYRDDHNKCMDVALAVEMFHNFSLVHDDIMDEAPLRRGQETVHKKWDINTGILSGDAMLIMAYQLFESYPAPTFRELARLFSKTAIQVCNGQQYDMNFETREDVRVAEYLNMIDGKTAVLVGAAIEMGAIVAGVGDRCRKNLYEFGRNLGMAFQLKDDYLDVFGRPDLVGKQTGGDIIANKKTFLYLSALEHCDNKQINTLKELFATRPENPGAKIAVVKDIFESCGVVESSLQKIEEYTAKACENLELVDAADSKKNALLQIARELVARES